MFMLSRYFCGEPVHFHSVTTARATLDAAHYYLCPQLAKMSVDYITKNLTATTVLSVYRGLGLYALGETDGSHGIPTAPPAPGDDAGEIGKSGCNIE